MNDWLTFWGLLRAPLENLHPLAPAAFLVALCVTLELAVDRWVAPWLAPHKPKMAEVLSKGFDGVRAGVLAGGFATLTTWEGQYAVLGAIAALVALALKTGVSELRKPPGSGPTSTALAITLALCLQNCTPTARYASHAAANTVAIALEWYDQKLACDFAAEAESFFESSEPCRDKDASACAADFERWFRASLWPYRQATIRCAFDAHGALVDALEGGSGAAAMAGVPKCLLETARAAALSPAAPVDVMRAATMLEGL